MQAEFTMQQHSSYKGTLLKELPDGIYCFEIFESKPEIVEMARVVIEDFLKS